MLFLSCLYHFNFRICANIKNVYLSPKVFFHIDGPIEPLSPIPGKFPKWSKDSNEIFQHLTNNSIIFLHGGAATVTHLANLSCQYAKNKNLTNIKVYNVHTEGHYPFIEKEYVDHFRPVSLFAASNVRKAIDEGIVDYIPMFLSEMPLLFRRKHVQLDYALINVSIPDQHGFCSLGSSVDITRSAIQNAKYIVGQVNKYVPFSRGEAAIHMSHIDYLITHDDPLHELPKTTPTPEEHKIGSLIADNLISDGATLQIGIGSIPDVVLSQLTKHRNLGIHTEMFSDGLVDLVKAGSVTNALKFHRPGKIVTTLVIGSRKVYDFIDNNPLVDMVDAFWVNSPLIIAQNPRPTAINSCIEIDLTGQVVSDSIGRKIYSGFGGQVDFMRGSAIAQDGLGKPILAMASTTRKGETKIVDTIKPGAGVVCTRAHVHYIVTEYGIAYLFGKSLRQRAHALIQVAHPNHREALEKASFEHLKCMPSPD